MIWPCSPYGPLINSYELLRFLYYVDSDIDYKFNFFQSIRYLVSICNLNKFHRSNKCVVIKCFCLFCCSMVNYETRLIPAVSIK